MVTVASALPAASPTPVQLGLFGVLVRQQSLGEEA